MKFGEARNIILEYLTNLPAGEIVYQLKIARHTGLSAPTVARYLDAMYFDGTTNKIVTRKEFNKKQIVYEKK